VTNSLPGIISELITGTYLRRLHLGHFEKYDKYNAMPQATTIRITSGMKEFF
jgi:hypothetical protein